MELKVTDKVNVTGRGYVFIFEADPGIELGDTFSVPDHTFTVVGVEKLTFVKSVGVILKPNDEAGKNIFVDDMLSFRKKNSDNA